MKDPFQQQETPYEILGLRSGATPEDIDRAFKTKLAARANVQKLTSARKTLLQPADRALVDLFDYHDSALSTLHPNPAGDATLLKAATRSDTAAAWIENLRRSFPNPSLTHAVAVCHYWWSIAETQRLAEAAGDGANASVIEEHWQLAISAWVAVLVDPAFWQSWSEIQSSLQQDLSKKILGRLSDDLHRFARQFHETGSTELAARLDRLSERCEDEFETATAMLATKLSNQRGALCAGKLLLDKLGLTDDVAARVHSASKRHPEERNLVFLSNALAKYGEIWFLLRRGRFDLAMDAIERLPNAQRATDEVCKLESHALHGLGKQQAAVKKWDKALELWDRAVAKAVTFEDRKDIQATIEKELIAASGEVSTDDTRDQWIDRLDRAQVALSKSKLALGADFSARLASLLCDRGIKVLNRVAEELSAGRVSAEAKRNAERGISDLERAKTLGSERAADQLPLAKRILDTSNSLLSPPSGPGRYPNQDAKKSTLTAELPKWWTRLPEWLRLIALIILLGIVGWWTVNELEILSKNEDGSAKSPFLQFVWITIWVLLPWGNVGRLISFVLALLLVVGATGHWVFKDRSEPAPMVAQQQVSSAEAKTGESPKPLSAKQPEPTPGLNSKANSSASKNVAQKKESSRHEVVKLDAAMAAAAQSAPVCPDPRSLVKATTIQERTQALQSLSSEGIADPSCRGALMLAAVDLAAALPALAEPVRPWATLLVAASMEATGDPRSALPHYQNLALSTGEFAITGQVRSSEIGQGDRKSRENIYEELRAKETVDAWFKTAEGWQRIDSRQAANLGLLDVRSGDWSIRLFETALRKVAPAPNQYRYLYVLAGLVLSLVLLELPVAIWNARFAATIARLRGPIEQIQRQHAGDRATMQRELAALYARHGVKPALGCLFVIFEWALWAAVIFLLSGWAPRLELDHARFFWIENVTTPDNKIFLFWWGAAALASIVTLRGPALQRWIGSLVFPLVIVAVAWYFAWPAYVLLAWALLMLSLTLSRQLVYRTVARK